MSTIAKAGCSRRSSPRLRLVPLLMLFAMQGVARADVPIGGPYLSDIAPPTGIVNVPPPPPPFNENCVVSILNRVAQVRPDGTWTIPNVPTNFGQIRARATCMADGMTRAGQSEPFTVPANGVVSAGEIVFDELAPIPTALRITAPTTTLTAVGATTQLTATAVFSDGSTLDVTHDPAVSYQSSNAAGASVSGAGVVTAHASGPVLITVLREGVSAFIRVTVSLSNTDSDGDGIPDDVEVSNGLDPNNPVDALEDPDHDGLTNKQELVDFGTDPHLADTDGDTLSDREEVFAGSDGFVTNPLAPDTDGDGVRDALEVQTGSDPTNPNSVNLAQALLSFELRPAMIVLTVNTILGEASQQLLALGHLRDGTTIDLTRRGTNYTSSDLTACNFGTDPGRVFAGMNGMCTISATNSGFSNQTGVTVRSFAPTALGFVTIPGSANNVDVNGGFAYVAAGATGLQVVNVSDPTHPAIVGAVDTPGNADDVKVAGTLAYVADEASGLQIVDVQMPSAPHIIGSIDTPGTAQGVVVRGTLAYVADGSGLQVIDVAAPTQPVRIGSLGLSGTAKGVDVEGSLAAVAVDDLGVEMVDVTDPTHPLFVGSGSTGGQVKDVILRGNTVYAADFNRSLTLLDVSNPANPVLGPSTPLLTGGRLNDVAVSGRFALGADVLFVNGIPIVDVSDTTNPIPRAILDFSSFRDDNGIGIAADGSYVYLAANHASLTDNSTSGDTRLYIGQYLALVDTAGVPPTVQVIEPRSGDTVLEGQTILLQADASDDVAVAGVGFQINGAVVSTDTVAPYQVTFTVPSAVSTLTIGATATDLGGNTGVAPDVVVNVVPDPRTTAVGKTVDLVGTAVANIAVTCLGVSGLSAADGRFSISGVPTVRGDVSCIAAFARGERLIRAVSGSAPPVGGGVTDVGVIREPAIIGGAGETDLWHFTANRGEVVTLMMTRVADQAGDVSALDPMLVLQDSRGFVVASNDEGGSNSPTGPGRNAVIENLTLPATDTYTVLASGAGGTFGSYSLSITPPTIVLTPQPPTAGAPPTFTFQGNIATQTEHDVFTIPANAGTAASIYVNRVVNRPDGSGTLDPVVELRDSRGFLVARNDDSGNNRPPGTGRNALIPRVTFPATDTYTVVVMGSNGTVGPYMVVVTFQRSAS